MLVLDKDAAVTKHVKTLSLVSLQNIFLSKFTNSGVIIQVLLFFMFCLPDFGCMYSKERGGTGINPDDFRRTSIEQSRKSLYRKEGVSMAGRKQL